MIFRLRLVDYSSWRGDQTGRGAGTAWHDSQ